jgi:hypothetical protein
VKIKLFLLALACAVVALPLFAASYVVPDDRQFIHQVNTIVVATAVDQRVLTQNGVWTSTTFRIDEVVNGPVFERLIDVIEPGTETGEGRRIEGIPRFEVGERALLFLRPRADGGWIVADLALGRFTFQRDVTGREILTRTGDDLSRSEAPQTTRDAAAFLDFVRGEVRGGRPAATYFAPAAPAVVKSDDETSLRFRPRIDIAPFSAASYTITGGPRRSTFPTPVSYNIGTVTEPGAPGGGVTAINSAMSAWSNVSGANIKIQYSGVATSDQGLCPTCSADHKNTIQFERNLSWAGVSPFTCSASSYSGVLGVGGPWTSGSHSGPNAEVFETITEGDVEMNQGLANCTLLFGNGDFNTAVTHEVGHSIGWRHSDQTRADNPGVACTSDPSLECSNSAVMKAFITAGINGAPTTWDQHAAQAVYPGAVTCTPPTVATQPTGSTITSGNSASLSVVAAGTSPFTYQWYTGASGNTASPVNGATAATVQVSPTTTTQYWVRVTGQCAPTADSVAVTVTVNQVICTAPQITGQPQSTSITSGNVASLSVAATGTSLSYQWYTGASGQTGNPVNGATFSSVNVNPSNTTAYWVRVSNSCGTADSNTVTVTVTAGCAAIQIVGQPQPKSITAGSSTSLSVSASSSATPLTYQWYIGTPGDLSSPIPNATSSTLTVTPANTTIYYARVTNSCRATQDSNAAQVTVNPPGCPAVTMLTPAVVQNGNTYTLTASPSGGTGLTVTWAMQLSGGGTQQVGTGLTINVTPTVTTTYVATARNSCGASLDAPVTITITPTAATCAAPTLTQPADVTVPPGGSTTLTVGAIGSGTLHYQWYQGAAPSTANGVGSDSPSFTTGPVASTTQYWVRVTNDCGSGASPSTASAGSTTITVTTMVARRRAAHH